MHRINNVMDLYPNKWTHICDDDEHCDISCDLPRNEIDYNNVVNKPKINGVSLEGDLDLDDLNIPMADELNNGLMSKEYVIDINKLKQEVLELQNEITRLNSLIQNI